jgi:large subunit ribosomal protein L6
MSRIGNAPIEIPTAVKVTLDGNTVMASGPLGELSMDLLPQVKVEIEGNTLTVKRKKDDQASRSVHGLTRSLLFNMITGV